jgi:hypothetical protein
MTATAPTDTPTLIPIVRWLLLLAWAELEEELVVIIEEVEDVAEEDGEDVGEEVKNAAEEEVEDENVCVAKFQPFIWIPLINDTLDMVEITVDHPPEVKWQC